jgi:transposase InsO family protein
LTCGFVSWLIGRAIAPNSRYVGDITYLPIGDGQFLCLATVLDLCSKRLAGWSIAGHMHISLVTDALKAAAWVRGACGLRGAIFHQAGTELRSVFVTRISRSASASSPNWVRASSS